MNFDRAKQLLDVAFLAGQWGHLSWLRDLALAELEKLRPVSPPVEQPQPTPKASTERRL